MKRLTTSKVILHCSASPHKNTTIDDIRRWQTDPKFPGGALPDVAYHFFISSDGHLACGLKEDERGYHTKGQNYCSIAICINGPVNKELGWPNEAQYSTILYVLSYLASRYPQASLHGHNEFRPDKECPAFNIEPLKFKWKNLVLKNKYPRDTSSRKKQE